VPKRPAVDEPPRPPRPLERGRNTPSQNHVLDLVERALDEGRREFVYWMGGVRAGKSYGSALALMVHQTRRSKAQYLVMAYTATQAANIYGPYFEAIGESMDVPVRVRQWRIEVGDGNVFHLKGGMAGKDRSIQGMTCDGLLADEVVLLERDTLHQAEARVSKPGSLRLYTTNKANKYHWTCKYYVRRIQEQAIKGHVVDCTVEENPHIDRDYIAERASEYEGNTLARFMENRFTLEGRPIYTVELKPPPSLLAGQYAHVIYAHPQGAEVLRVGRYLREDGPCIHVYQGESLDGDTDVARYLGGQPGGLVLLNNEATELCRRLRTVGYYVRGYRSHCDEERAQRIITACQDRRISVDESQEGLVEAVQTYAEWNRSDFPIMTAFEALGHLLS